MLRRIIVGEAQISVIRLEILAVALAGPCATYIAYLISKIVSTPAGREKARLFKQGCGFSQRCLLRENSMEVRFFIPKLTTTMPTILGGFMTFCPEWLSGNTQLAGGDAVYMWLYQVFFTVLWVLVPAWVL